MEKSFGYHLFLVFFFKILFFSCISLFLCLYFFLFSFITMMNFKLIYNTFNNLIWFNFLCFSFNFLPYFFSLSLSHSLSKLIWFLNWWIGKPQKNRVIFFSGPATKAFKKFFFLSGQALTPSPLLVAGPIKKNFFCGFPSIFHFLAKKSMINFMCIL